jgi:hypothetical protein
MRTLRPIHAWRLVILGRICTYGLHVQAGNKFETIGGGVSGSTALKLAHLQPVSLAFGVFFLIAALLSLSSIGHKNALSPNHSLWKQSAAILFGLSLVSFAAALLL